MIIQVPKESIQMKIEEYKVETAKEYHALKKHFDEYVAKYKKIIHEVEIDTDDGLKITMYARGVRDYALGND